MDYKTLKENNLTTITPDQNIKDGDTVLSFNLTTKQFDPGLGTPVADKITVVNINTLQDEIANLQSQLDSKNLLLADLQSLPIPVPVVTPPIL